MKGLEAIKKQIIEDARAESDKLLDQARQRAEERRSARLAAQAKTLAELRTRNSEEAAMRKERMLTAARLEARKRLLSVKQEMIGKSFVAAEEKIRSLPAEQYREFMADVVTRYAETGNEEVTVSGRDLEVLDQEFIRMANQRLQAAGKTGAMKLSDRPGDFDGGLVMIGRNSEINCTLKALVRQVRQSLESEVAQILFR